MIEAMYVHVPFCKSICSYCDFTRVGCNARLIQQWLQALQKEVDHKDINPNLKTIYVGGGTPSALNEEELECLLELLSPYAHNVKEYTIEINPETMTPVKYLLLQKYGVNRISIGVQSISERLLKLMNRSHSWTQVIDVINCLHDVGIKNISLDCMYSLPTQSSQELLQTLQAYIDLEVSHISMYSLTIEENSQFYREHYEKLHDEQEEDYYFKAIELLEGAGYFQYEISNFAKPGFESLHNQVYWRYEDFYGVGLGASGKENHKRYTQTSNFQDYFLQKGLKEIHLSEEDEMFEFIMMNLRLRSGFDINRFNELFGHDFLMKYKHVIQKLTLQDLIQLDNQWIKCTEKGYPLLHSILEEFI